MSEKFITVADLDPMMPTYSVYSAKGFLLGEKTKLFGYLKPEYDRHGVRRFGMWAGFEDRKYKTTPPWFKLRVVEIKTVGYGIGVYVKEDGNR